TPGHTPGSTCLLVGGADLPALAHQQSVPPTLLVSGDTLFAGGATGRCDLRGGFRPLAEKSLYSLLSAVDDETVLLPGHGASSTVGQANFDAVKPSRPCALGA